MKKKEEISLISSDIQSSSTKNTAQGSTSARNRLMSAQKGNKTYFSMGPKK